MLCELTITTKGQVTLRRSVLEHLGLTPGDKVGVCCRMAGWAKYKRLRLAAGL
jgi:bifunctional DNA-binding transcriptional regulator/antitoxin component of YhaV-PrlF toxin-antitoxin module